MDIYPAIDLKGGKCVRLSQGQFAQITTYSEDPLKMAKRWKAEGAQRLHIVDLDGARKGSPDPTNLEVLRQIVRQVGLPIQFGGGVRSGEVVERMLRLGVERVVVGTTAATEEKLIEGLFTVYGDKIVVGVDARDGMVAIQAWQMQVNEPALSFIGRMVKLGAKRFVFTDISKDGMLEGVNLEAIRNAAQAAQGRPLIASGGVTSMKDIEALLQLRQQHPNVEGAIIGKALYAGTLSLPEVIARVKAE
ncbi:1-(5-phosphoribosyl)-5-[(5-phosphoribosylamino)methylideneamino]imidazole-4-carboxamide isomerase [Chthonomonas calidirosea]|uniref:1-(5-phosphoribosyl)-5-[(5- phosphoribosylamino)methylideneamino]imidazole-4- carboxamide isomerase n=1 Tax=Chthonomonas calidirosea TaxID=454171 RepID=UPI0006EC8C32|nr:1-(5-phosphoribosyl)-5-[(5-phosphoribosylamino)methylideneamino]imidazole-4-carboxamide isomerase [Chthonomonas calidirosea]CEK17594.1 1-(5-phosphoribosyl)-5-((5-phosphoribosylamino)methylideneamino) imidazole-4-carboxamide isomerase [Chthonomonas calidirosea]